MRFVLGIAAALFWAFGSSADARPPYESSAPIAYMIDLSSGAVLFDKDSRRQIPPASMAKMMTTYVVFDMLAKDELDLDQKFTISPQLWQQWNNRGSTMFLSSGERVSVANLLHGTVTVSGNDASIALAEGIAGSEAAFTKRMNKVAHNLGMKNSRFGTANGWPDEGRTQTTAQDLARLAARTIENYPLLYHKFYGRDAFSWNGVTQADRNPIAGKIKGADGLKTGHTDEAGYCFTGSAEQNGRRIIMVVAGLDSYNARITESTKFLQWGFDAWTSKPLYKDGDIVADIPVQLGTDRKISLAASRNFGVTLPKDDNMAYNGVVRYKGPVKAPIMKGDHVADLVIRLSDGGVQTMPLFAAKSVGATGFFGRAYNGLISIFTT